MTRPLFASALLVFATAASANNGIVVSSYSPPTAHISTASLDLRSTAGRVIVERRIERAARMVCQDPEADRSVLQPTAQLSDCYLMAVSSGISQLEDLAGK